MQICSKAPSAVRAMVISLEDSFPIHAPYLNRLHYSRSHPADYLHYHHSWEIGICLQGSGIFYIGTRVYRYTAGDVSIIPPDVVHIAQSDPDRISGWKFLDVDLARLLQGWGPKEETMCAYTGIIRPDDHPSVAPLILQVLEELHLERPHARTLVRLKMAELTVYLNRLAKGDASVSLLPDSLYEISPAVLHIINHYAEPITLAQLASMCSMSVSSFRRSFGRIMNTTPFEYLYHVRVKAAVNLLQTTRLPVSEIAARVGYPSLSSFQRHFLRIAGTSPLLCRKQKQNSAKPQAVS